MISVPPSEEPDVASAASEVESPGQALPSHVQKDLLTGTSALGIGVIAERGCSFLANILAARIGGASTFGVYALAISTANNISAYAAGGIGSTAIRFSGEHPRGSDGYLTLARVLAVISTVSAFIAAIVLWWGAGPITKLLGKPSLLGALQWASLSAAGIILLECCRGFLVGQRRIKALLLLSGLVGAGYLTLLPLAAHLGPMQMITSQSVVTLGAVGVCLLAYRSLQLQSPNVILRPEPFAPLLKTVWGFGFVQLASLMGMNAAGWWLTTLIARSDTTMAQMGYFAVAHQLRNIVALGPSLLTESSLAVMAGRDGRTANTPDRVMALCTYASTVVSLVLAGLGMLVLPWAMPLLYGQSYAPAAAATALALTTAVIHMGSAPVSARLSIVSIKTTGVVNTIWAIFVATAASLVLFNHGDAAKGAAVYLAGHLFVATLQLLSLHRWAKLPSGTVMSFATGSGGAIALALLAYGRQQSPEYAVLLTITMLVVLAITLAILFGIGKTKGWLPAYSTIAGGYRRVHNKLRGRRAALDAQAKTGTEGEVL